MGKELRAARIKTRLWEITSELSGKGTNSLEVVRVFRERYPELDDVEQEDLIDLGLMVLAGRVSVSSNPVKERSPDFFSQDGFPDFVPVRIKSGNKFVLVRKMGRNLTAREYFANVIEPIEEAARPKRITKRQQFHMRMLEMREKGLLDTTLPDYLKQEGG